VPSRVGMVPQRRVWQLMQVNPDTPCAATVPRPAPAVSVSNEVTLSSSTASISFFIGFFLSEGGTGHTSGVQQVRRVG